MVLGCRSVHVLLSSNQFIDGHARVQQVNAKMSQGQDHDSCQDCQAKVNNQQTEESACTYCLSLHIHT